MFKSFCLGLDWGVRTGLYFQEIFHQLRVVIAEVALLVRQEFQEGVLDDAIGFLLLKVGNGKGIGLDFLANRQVYDCGGSIEGKPVHARALFCGNPYGFALHVRVADGLHAALHGGFQAGFEPGTGTGTRTERSATFAFNDGSFHDFSALNWERACAGNGRAIVFRDASTAKRRGALDAVEVSLVAIVLDVAPFAAGIHGAGSVSGDGMTSAACVVGSAAGVFHFGEGGDGAVAHLVPPNGGRNVIKGAGLLHPLFLRGRRFEPGERFERKGV